LIVDWIQENVEGVAVDSFSALDVLATRKAECQGNSYLYAALGRSLGIPTRIVNGLVYSDNYGGGFFYHTWAESLIDNRWVPVDPTFGQVVADATHIKLLEGESLDQLAPLVGLMGRLQATVVAVEYDG
jgi:transglutaminase-like putative cysteine protease